MSLAEQELPTLPGHPSSVPVLGGCIAAQFVQCFIGYTIICIYVSLTFLIAFV